MRLVNSEDTLRVCDLMPVDGNESVAVLGLIKILSDAAVNNRYGGTLVPRSIIAEHIEPSAVIREPGPVIIETSDSGVGGRRPLSIVETSSDRSVRIREGMWEKDGTINYSSILEFVLGCLLFARRIHSGTSVEQIDLKIGVVNALGRTLVDEQIYSGFFRTYIATSDKDLVVGRRLRVPDLDDAEARVAIGRNVIDELGGLFGFALSDSAWDAHVKNAEDGTPGLTT